MRRSHHGGDEAGPSMIMEESVGDNPRCAPPNCLLPSQMSLCAWLSLLENLNSLGCLYNMVLVDLLIYFVVTSN